jgi:hypothetical protein
VSRLPHRGLHESQTAPTRRVRPKRTLSFAWGEAGPEDEEVEEDEEDRAELTFFWAGPNRMGKRRPDAELVFEWADDKDVTTEGSPALEDSPPHVGRPHTEGGDGRGMARAAVPVRRDVWAVRPSRQPTAPMPTAVTLSRETQRPAEVPTRFSPRARPSSSSGDESPDLQAAAVLQDLVASVATMLCGP